MSTPPSRLLFDATQLSFSMLCYAISFFYIYSLHSPCFGMRSFTRTDPLSRFPPSYSSISCKWMIYDACWTYHDLPGPRWPHTYSRYWMNFYSFWKSNSFFLCFFLDVCVWAHHCDALAYPGPRAALWPRIEWSRNRRRIGTYTRSEDARLRLHWDS